LRVGGRARDNACELQREVVRIVPARVVFGKRAFVVSLVVGVVLSAAGCGEDEQAGVEGWANGVCGNLSEWITDVDGAVTSLTEDGLALDEDDLRDAVDQTQDATDELTEDLRDLGPPETPSGQRAALELDALISDLQEQVDRVEQAVSGTDGLLEVATSVAAAVAAAVARLEETVDVLRQLDAGGELEAAFTNADDCESLRQQVDDIGS
jgi:methyl-accepting chemotaxis protein